MNIDFSKVELKEGFWLSRQKINREISLPAIKESYVKTKRFDAVKCAYKKWKFWIKPPHIFYDSDVAKFIEAWSYHLMKKRDEEIESFIDDIIASIVKSQRSDGYYNAHFLVTRKDKVFTYRSEHELYCLGHLIESAIAYDNATGKKALLGVVERYLDYVEKRFLINRDTAFTCPGHPEIELALIKLYEHTGNEKYLEMAKYFIYVRGTEEGDKGLNKMENRNPWCDGYYAQDFLPLREQRTAEGHCVRACYLYSGATDVARIEKDDELIFALKSIYENIVDRRMYVTGGIGAKALTEAFDKDFILPNDFAYTESCASISLIMFARRLQEIERNSQYADLIERVLYNGFLSGVSLSGDRFFYENPLEIDLEKRKVTNARYPIPERQKDFSCSCCPPNIARLIGSVGSLVYAYEDGAIYIDQYIASRVAIEDGDRRIAVDLDTSFPKSSTLNIVVSGASGKTIRVRIPEWNKGVDATEKYYIENGYMVFNVEEDHKEIGIKFGYEIEVLLADQRVKENAGKCYVKYGPIIYCAEGMDNGRLDDYELRVEKESVSSYWQKEYNAYSLVASAVKKGEERKINLIPYFAFANRGLSDMKVYLNSKK